MSIAFRSAGTAANGAAPVSLTVTKPAGTVDGDVMVAFVTISADKTIAAAPAGWTLLDEQNTGSATGDCRHAVYWKVASSEGANYVWDFSGGADAAAVIVAYSGVSTGAPINVSGHKLMTGSTVTHTAPSVTPGSANTYTITAYAVNPFATDDTTFTTPAGLTVRGEADPEAGTTNRAVLKVFDISTPTAVATGDNVTTVNHSAKGVAYTVTVAPLAAADLALTVSPYRVVASATGCMIGWHEDSFGNYDNMESLLGTTFAMRRIYHEPAQWGTVSSQVTDTIDAGSMPVVSHKPPKVANVWIAINAGTYDAQISALVAAYKALAPTEVVVIFHHEPHGNMTTGSKSPTYGTPSDFVKAFRRFSKAFKDANADNVKIGYCAIDSHADDYPNDPGYPGDDYVDVLCHDVYNWGGYPGFSAWTDPAALFGPFVADAKAANKPLIFGEIGCHPTAGAPGHSRAQWITDMGAYFKTGDAATYVLGFCYYHVDSHGGSGHYWRFAEGTTADAKNEFIAAFSNDSHYLGEPITPALAAAAPDPGGLGGGAPSGGTPPSVQGLTWARKSTVGGIPVGYGEVSGVCSSPKGGLWAIRDSGNPVALNWLTQTSRGTFAIHDVTVTGATNGDWEDCFYSIESGTAYIYIHDNRDGNSAGALPRRLYKVAEPATPSAASSVALTATYYWSFPGSASSSTCGSQQNCEAMFIFKGVIYAVQKTDATEAEVYSLATPGSLSTNSAAPTMGVKVGTIACHCPSAFSLSADGTTVVTVQHGQTKVFRGKGDTIASLLTGKNSLVFSDQPGGSGEGADWWPYQSSDFLVVSEDRDTFDYDVASGRITTSGIASTVTFGTPAVTIGGAIRLTSVGAIPAPGDYEGPEEDPGIDFGTPTVTFTDAPNPDPDDLEGEFLFSPPIVYDVPRVLPETIGAPFLLMRHYSNLPRGRTVIKIGGSYRTVDNPEQFTLDAATEVYLGGHIYTVTADVAEALVAAGYTLAGAAPRQLLILTEDGDYLVTESRDSLVMEG